jgi:hypothetical protein
LCRVRRPLLPDLSPAAVTAFITESGTTIDKRSVQSLCSILKVFFRYLYRVGLMTRDLSKAIESPRRYSFSSVPRAITWSEVERMLQEVDRRSPVGKRDYAILLLLVTYGLRAREVGALTLDDIDWKRDNLHIRGRKAGHSTAYPLAPTAGCSLGTITQNNQSSLLLGSLNLTDLRDCYSEVSKPGDSRHEVGYGGPAIPLSLICARTRMAWRLETPQPLASSISSLARSISWIWVRIGCRCTTQGVNSYLSTPELQQCQFMSDQQVVNERLAVVSPKPFAIGTILIRHWCVLPNTSSKSRLKRRIRCIWPCRPQSDQCTCDLGYATLF